MNEHIYSKPSYKRAVIIGKFIAVLSLCVLICGVSASWYMRYLLELPIFLAVIGTVVSVILALLIYNTIVKIERSALRKDKNRAHTKYYYAFIDRYNARPLSKEIIVNKINDFDIGDGVVIRALPTVCEDGVTPLLIQINNMTNENNVKEENPNEDIYKYY